ncbi:MAG: hypothetical protein PQ612_06645 [Rickettsiales bacterium]|nr:hypothetical protein [Pseudomonadota bacterium]MDA0966652.1 hypothetical protein [Pseudomonadota bacterium]MDG4543680.1 hypothetical protein [Rickettsiales bacterium]MDG4545827.1 hypothetical protein [Rickettsiales bacterium]MDG4547399.1 hypothetical protein [Rickettsiales bacterium]
MSAVTKETPDNIIEKSEKIQAKGADVRVKNPIQFGGKDVAMLQQPSPDRPINDNKIIEQDVMKAKSSERANVVQFKPKIQQAITENLKGATREEGQDKKGIQNNSPDEPDRTR